MRYEKWVKTRWPEKAFGEVARINMFLLLSSRPTPGKLSSREYWLKVTARALGNHSRGAISLNLAKEIDVWHDRNPGVEANVSEPRLCSVRSAKKTTPKKTSGAQKGFLSAKNGGPLLAGFCTEVARKPTHFGGPQILAGRRGPQQKNIFFAWLVESPKKAKKQKGELILGKKFEKHANEGTQKSKLSPGHIPNSPEPSLKAAHPRA